MIKVGAPGDEVHDAAVGDVPAVLDLQPPQLGALPRHDGQAPVGDALAPAQTQRLHRGQPASPVAVPGQQPEDGADGEVGVEPRARQRDLLPEVGLPGEEVEPPAHPGAEDQLGGVEEGEDSDDDRIWQQVERAAAAERDRARRRRRPPCHGRVLRVVGEDVQVPDGGLRGADVPQVGAAAARLHRRVVRRRAARVARAHRVVADVADGGGGGRRRRRPPQLPREQLLLQLVVRRPREHHGRQPAELVLVRRLRRHLLQEGVRGHRVGGGVPQPAEGVGLARRAGGRRRGGLQAARAAAGIVGNV